MEKEIIVDQSVLAKDLSEKIKYSFLDFFLIKPLDPVKVKKEFSKPVSNNKPEKDTNGIEAVDFDTVETEVKEVNSDYRRGVILKRPLYYENIEKSDENVVKINIGDVVIFRDTAGLSFDLLKDSKLLRQYDIIGKEA